MKGNRIIEVAVKVVVAALTAFVTAISTTSCAGYGPLYF
jgi:predicted small lipoprotein YifL